MLHNSDLFTSLPTTVQAADVSVSFREITPHMSLYLTYHTTIYP